MTKVTREEAIEHLKDCTNLRSANEEQIKALTYVLAVLERVDTDFVIKAISNHGIVQDFGNDEEDVIGLAQAIVKELTGEVGK